MAEQPFASNLKPGVTLDKYEVREQIAAGGMAVIYKAYDPTLDRYVAIKQIAPHLSADEKFAVRFRNEAQTLARLSSSQANIVHVHELLQQDGQLYLVMEYVEGTTLRQYMDKGPVPLQTGLGVLLSVALGLRAMHAQGIVHRDLTPANIMMAKDGALKITDFGLIGHSGGRTSLPMGTTKYMAPEMFTGTPIDPRADLYSLGMIALEMFVGPEKFGEAFRDVLRDVKAQQVRWMHWHSNVGLRAPSLKELQPGIPPLVAKIVERLLDKDPSKRFASADQVVRWLRKIFVMNVQGKSVTQSDSETLEKEMDADAGRPMVGMGAGAAARGGAAGGAAGAAASTLESGDKTAPLPQPKWTLQRTLFWAAVVVGPILLVSTGLLIYKYNEEQKRVSVARDAVDRADDLFRNKQWADAIKEYSAITQQFRDLRERATYAYTRMQMAQAEQALQAENWHEADTYRLSAQEKNADPAWVNDFSTRFQKAKFVKEQLILAANERKKGDLVSLKAAKDRLNSLLEGHPELSKDISITIGEVADQIEMIEYRELIDKGKEALRRNDAASLTDAQTFFLSAQKKRDTTETKELLQFVANEAKFREFYMQAEKEAAAGKWDISARDYEESMKYRASEAVRAKMLNAKAEACAAQARTFKEIGQAKEATDAYRKALEYNPAHKEALEFLKLQSQADQLAGYRRAAEEAMAKQQWEAVINNATLAKPLVAATDAATLKSLDDMIQEATYQRAIGRARDALAANDFEKAVQFQSEAQTAKDTQEVKDLAAQIDKRKQYKMHLDLGKEFLGRAEYVKALAEFKQALKIEDSTEVRTLISEAEYRRNMAQGKLLKSQRQWAGAASVFGIARKFNDTVEAQAEESFCKKQAAAAAAKEGGP